MKNFKLVLITILAMAIFMPTQSFAQSSSSTANISGISYGKKITLPDGSTLQGMSVYGESDNNNPITGAALLTSNCPTPVWDAQGAGGKTKPCNSACFLLQVIDSTGTGGLGGHSNPGWQVEIGPMDGQQCTQNNVEIWLNGAKSYQIGTSVGCTGSCVWLGSLSSWFGAGICANLQRMIISSSYFGPTTTVEIKITDSGNNGSYAWVMRDLATAGVAGSGTWNFSPSGTGTTGVHSKSTTGIGKGTATFTSLSCPAGVSPCPPTGSFINAQNGYAQFCPSAAGVKPGKYAFRYNWNDGIGCNKSYTDTITITTANDPAWTPSGTLCVGQNYSLTNFITGNVGGTWSGTTDVTSGGTFTPSSATTYTVAYTVGTGNCAVSQTRTLTATAQPTVTASATPSSVCANGATTVTLSAGGASTYVWSGGLGASSSVTASPSSTTTYTVTGTAVGGCSNTRTVTVTINPAPSASLAKVDIKCKGVNNGTLTSSVSSGTSAFTYAWSNSATTQNVSNLATGIYSLTVTDSRGCTSSASATINEPPTALSLPTPSSSPTGCGSNTGTASASASGGTGALTYSWSGGKTGGSITGLAAGTYIVTVTDANACTITGSATVAPPVGGPTITIDSQKNLKCNGDVNGNAYTSATGGSGTYDYSWSTGSTGSNSSSSVINVAAGTYTVTYTDKSSSCANTRMVTITEPNPFVMNESLSQIICKGTGDGSITLNPTGNNPGYTYDWSPINKQTKDVTGLSPGTYTVEISDSQGCSKTFSYTITEPATGVTATATLTTQASCGLSDGSATASASGGTGTKTYSWSNGSTTTIITGLSAGSYIVTVTDGSGCSSTSSVAISNSGGPTLASVNKTDASCGQNDGTATANASGGTAPLTYSWTPSGGNTASISNLAAGTYNVIVIDANGCSTAGSVTVTGVAKPTAGLTASKYLGENPLPVDFVGSGGTIYVWDFGDGSPLFTGGANPSHTYTKDGTFRACVLVSSGTVGCVDSTCKDITVSGFKIDIPNIITPNGDNKNDTYVIRTKGVTKLDITIWDRWGLKMWEGTGLPADALGNVSTWDGKTTAGKECPDGTYYYMLTYYKFDGSSKEEQGFVTLVR